MILCSKACIHVYKCAINNHELSENLKLFRGDNNGLELIGKGTSLCENKSMEHSFMKTMADSIKIQSLTIT